LQVGEQELLFDVRLPTLDCGDPYRTSYINAFRRRSIFDFLMVVTKINLPNDDEDTPAFCDSAAASTFPSPEISGEIRMDGFSWLTVSTISIRDGDGDLSPEDERGNELSFSGEGKTIY